MYKFMHYLMSVWVLLFGAAEAASYGIAAGVVEDDVCSGGWFPRPVSLCGVVPSHLGSLYRSTPRCLMRTGHGSTPRCFLQSVQATVQEDGGEDLWFAEQDSKHVYEFSDQPHYGNREGAGLEGVPFANWTGSESVTGSGLAAVALANTSASDVAPARGLGNHSAQVADSPQAGQAIVAHADTRANDGKAKAEGNTSLPIADAVLTVAVSSRSNSTLSVFSQPRMGSERLSGNSSSRAPPLSLQTQRIGDADGSPDPEQSQGVAHHLVVKMVQQATVLRESAMEKLMGAGTPLFIMTIMVAVVAVVFVFLIMIYRLDHSHSGGMRERFTGVHREQSFPPHSHYSKLPNNGLASPAPPALSVFNSKGSNVTPPGKHTSPPFSGKLVEAGDVPIGRAANVGSLQGMTPRATAEEAQQSAPTSLSSFNRKRKLLCPGLEVPRGSECLLAVPTLQSCGIPPQDEVTFIVRDLHGTQVIQCEVRVPDWSAGDRSPILLLRAASPRSQGEQAPLLACCQVGPLVGNKKSVMIQDANREPFASLVQHPSRQSYALSVYGGPLTVFTGNFAENTMTVANENQEPLADTEPSPVSFDTVRAYYRLRVASKVDVGLILCCMVSIHIMEMHGA